MRLRRVSHNRRARSFSRSFHGRPECPFRDFSGFSGLPAGAHRNGFVGSGRSVCLGLATARRAGGRESTGKGRPRPAVRRYFAAAATAAASYSAVKITRAEHGNIGPRRLQACSRGSAAAAAAATVSVSLSNSHSARLAVTPTRLSPAAAAAALARRLRRARPVRLARSPVAPRVSLEPPQSLRFRHGARESSAPIGSLVPSVVSGARVGCRFLTRSPVSRRPLKVAPRRLPTIAAAAAAARPHSFSLFHALSVSPALDRRRPSRSLVIPAFVVRRGAHHHPRFSKKSPRESFCVRSSVSLSLSPPPFVSLSLSLVRSAP